MRSRRTSEGARGTALRSGALGKAAAVLLASLTLAGLTGCGTAPPTRLEASLVAAEDVNQDELGRALPVVVRVYELKTAGGFQAADFYGLYDQEGAALGGDLLAREELQLRPGERREIAREVAPGAQHLGVAGAYRQIDKARWRDIHALKQGETNKVEIHLGASAVSIR